MGRASGTRLSRGMGVCARVDASVAGMEKHALEKQSECFLEDPIQLVSGP